MDEKLLNDDYFTQIEDDLIGKLKKGEVLELTQKWRKKLIAHLQGFEKDSD